MKTFGLDWRIPLALECWFYFRICRNWKSVIRGRLRGTPFMHFELRGGAIIGFTGLPPWRVFQEIWRKEIYTRTYPHDWTLPQTVVDIGANIGIFSLYAASRWHPARIIAIEPAPGNIRVLEKNIELSRAAQIRVYPRAVAASPGSTPFYLKRESGWHSFSDEGALEKISVGTITLGTILAGLNPDAIDFMKVDCEGAEYEFLRGQEERLAKVRFIAMEYHEAGNQRVKELTETLARAGFAYEALPEPRWNTGMLYARNLNHRARD